MGHRSERKNQDQETAVLGKPVQVRPARMDRTVLAVYLYRDGMKKLLGLDAEAMRFFMWLVVMHLRRPDGVVVANKEVVEAYMKWDGKLNKSFYRRIAKCTEAGVLKRMYRATYLVNNQVVCKLKTAV